ncbi:MAG: hypothetical protein FVQ77_02905 [Cytophagales bacterium]|nr:hypothetical protein [Cytophagales bacterium]
MTDNKREKRRIIKIQLLIGFIVILVAIIAIEFFLKQTEVKKLKYSHKIKMEQVHAQLDSIQHELVLRYDEVAQLGGDTAELRMIINQIEQDKANLEIRVKNATARYTRMEGKVNAYKKLLLKKDEELAKLRTDNEKLFKINIGLKTTIIEQGDSIRVIQKDKDKLEVKVAIASELKIKNIKYSYINKKGKEVVVKDGKPFKSSAVDKIKISFHLPANKVSRKGGKDIMLRVIEPEGSVVLAGSPSSSRFECEGKELLFTSKKTILYDNKEKNVAFLYHQNSYKTGKHITELYADGRQIGKGAFYIK